AFEAKVEPALAQRLEGIALLRAPLAAIPQQHLAGAVLLLRDHALEFAVLERMVFGLHREALVGGVEARAFRHRPALEHALELEAKVVVQPRRRMALDVIAQRLFPCRDFPSATRGLRRDGE